MAHIPGQQKLSIKIDCPTHWGSTFMMLDWLCTAYHPIQVYLAVPRPGRAQNLSPEEWALLFKVQDKLQLWKLASIKVLCPQSALAVCTHTYVTHAALLALTLSLAPGHRAVNSNYHLAPHHAPTAEHNLFKQLHEVHLYNPDTKL
jgi:hypothetical protein